MSIYNSDAMMPNYIARRFRRRRAGMLAPPGGNAQLYQKLALAAQPQTAYSKNVGYTKSTPKQGPSWYERAASHVYDSIPDQRTLYQYASAPSIYGITNHLVNYAKNAMSGVSPTVDTPMAHGPHSIPYVGPERVASTPLTKLMNGQTPNTILSPWPKPLTRLTDGQTPNTILSPWHRPLTKIGPHAPKKQYPLGKFDNSTMSQAHIIDRPIVDNIHMQPTMRPPKTRLISTAEQKKRMAPFAFGAKPDSGFNPLDQLNLNHYIPIDQIKSLYNNLPSVSDTGPERVISRPLTKPMDGPHSIPWVGPMTSRSHVQHENPLGPYAKDPQIFVRPVVPHYEFDELGNAQDNVIKKPPSGSGWIIRRAHYRRAGGRIIRVRASIVPVRRAKSLYRRRNRGTGIRAPKKKRARRTGGTIMRRGHYRYVNGKRVHVSAVRGYGVRRRRY